MEISEFSIADVAAGLRRNKIKIFLCFVLIMGSAVAASVLLPRTYESKSQLLVRLGRENATLDSTANLREGSSIDVSQNREFETNSVATMLRSRVLAERVVDELGAAAILEQENAVEDGSPGGASHILQSISQAKAWVRGLIPSSSREVGPRDEAIDVLITGLRIMPIEETNIIQISYRSHDPELAQRVVENVVENYLDEHVRIHRAAGARGFLIDHAQRLGDELSEAEKELVELKNQTHLSAPVEQRTLLVDRLAALRTDLFTLEATLAESRAEMDELTKTLARIESGDTDAAAQFLGATSEEADGMRTQLYQLQLEAEASLNTYTEDHVKARRLRSQIATAKSILARQEATIEIQQRRPIVVAHEAKAEKIREQIAEVEQELSRLNEDEMRVAQLQRSVEIRDATFRRLAEDAEQSRIEASLEEAKITNISVVQPASNDPFAVFPNTRLNLAIGLFLSLFASLGIAVLFGEKPRQEPPTSIAVSRSTVLRADAPQLTPSVAAAKLPEESMALSKPR